MTSRLDTTPNDVELQLHTLTELQPYSLTAEWLGLGNMGNATMEGYRALCPFQKS